MLNLAWKAENRALDVLEKMVRITMMRGAQSGGVVTYADDGDATKTIGLRGVRSRVCNGKRTDLSKLVRDAAQSRERYTQRSARQIPLYAGHTRFATSSIASLPGTHPHQWTPARKLPVYDKGSRKVPKAASPTNVENYICHNGDLEFFKIGGSWYETGDVQGWLERVTETPMPASVDSAAIAGIMDIQRCQGCWPLAVRFGFHFGIRHVGIHYDVPKFAEFVEVAKVFDKAFQDVLRSFPADLLKSSTDNIAFQTLEGPLDSSVTSTTARSARSSQVSTADLDVSVDGGTAYTEGDNKSKFSPTPRLDRSQSKMVRGSRRPTDPLYQSGTRHGERMTWWQLAASRRQDVKAAVVEAFAATEARGVFNLDVEDGLNTFVDAVVNAFFDNDLFHTTRRFLTSARGSFGLAITSSLDAARQMVVAARGQTISVAFYPKLGLVLYGSEQAAVKAGLGMKAPPGSNEVLFNELNDPAMRLDLDDLGGEITLVDWGRDKLQLAPREAYLPRDRVMEGTVTLVSAFEEVKVGVQKFRDRLVPLEDNPLMLPIMDPCDDVVKRDIEDIPRVCKAIQDDWKEPNMNRMSAWTLGRRLKQRLQHRRQGKLATDAVDILITGCEVSLWVGEQFASDLSALMPKLNIKTTSSNKILGLLGQEFPVPQCGHALTEHSWDLDGTIVIIVSHSGGTFAPLATSNLMQAKTNNIFVVASEWDTQVGKQLRKMRSAGSGMFDSRVFSTQVGVRPSEPCTVSVAATHQLLTLLLEYMCQTVLAVPDLRAVAGCIYSDQDLAELERCNVDNIAALSEIVGVDENGFVPAAEGKNPKKSPRRLAEKLSDDDYAIDDVRPSDGGFAGGRGRTETERALRRSGEAWAQHVLEAPRAWIVCAVYIVVTVTLGYPLVSGVGAACGVSAVWALRLMGFFDALIYVFVPQLACLLIRAVQGRPMFHRMTARTVVVGDCPWVAQSIEAYLSKLFACAYSVASVGVLSGNPADHLVHRHTHRVMRGTLMVCGRPDGRLSALTTLESTVCLSVNQASSIQNFGVTCESVTIGHNPNKLPLSAGAVFLKSFRPRYLCEQLLKEAGTLKQSMSSGALLGEFSNLKQNAGTLKLSEMSQIDQFDHVNNEINREGRQEDRFRKAFDAIDVDGSGDIDFDEFAEAYEKLGGFLEPDDLRKIFEDGDLDGNGTLDFDEFLSIMKMDKLTALTKLGQKTDSGMSAMQCVEPSEERYFGEMLRAPTRHAHSSASFNKRSKQAKQDDFTLVASQNVSMHLYETRVASLQRFTSMCVMFHEMGKRVQDFWPAWTAGCLGYDMSRTHSIMRIATTASPVSGAEVRDRMVHMTLMSSFVRTIRILSHAAREYKLAKDIEAKYHLIQRNKSKRGNLVSVVKPNRVLGGLRNMLSRKEDLPASGETSQLLDFNRRLSLEERRDMLETARHSRGR